MNVGVIITTVFIFLILTISAKIYWKRRKPSRRRSLKESTPAPATTDDENPDVVPSMGRSYHIFFNSSSKNK